MKPNQLNRSSLSGKILGIKNSINKIYNRIKRLVEYIPVIWNTEDYDYSFTVDILMYQLERQADYLEKHKRHVDWQYDANRIRLAVRLLDLGVNEKYAERVDDYFTRTYGESTMNFNPVESIDEDAELYGIGIWWANADDSETNNIINEQYYEQMNEARYKSEKAYSLAWKIIEKDLKSWWD